MLFFFSPPGRSSTFRAVLALIATAALLSPLPSRAQASQPAKKDSIARLKPKEAVLAASVSPAEARSGDVVTYKVTAKLKPGWHIYTFAKDQQGEGPRNTQFDFFDTGGMTTSGEWTASKEPIRKKEPAFPGIDVVTFFEDEVTWSIPLKVPSNAAPGKRTLRCQASYQVCSASSCSFPGQWTLPDVELTVVPGVTPSAPSDAAVTPASAPPQPKKPDTLARLKPKNAALTATVTPAEAKPGETVTYRVTAKLDPGWHIYEYAKEPPADGPRPTQFDFFDTGGLTVAGDWKSETPALVKEEPAFNSMVVSFFEDEATWNLPLKVPADASPGSKTLRCQAAYQICDANSCSPPGRWTLPDVVLTVLPATSTATVTPPAPPPLSAPKPEPPKVASREPGSPAEAAKPPAPPSAAARPRAVSDVEKTAQRGIIPVMVLSALGGLLALVMPCVWPMVPITVNFFVKQGQKNKGRTTELAIAYCLAIIGIFTTVGVLCSFFFSASALPSLANNPWLNLFVAGLFVAFGLSLLGLFEVRLPNALLNASARGEGRGGLIGVMFMALTLTITSFTCTFPVVGGLLVMAANGEFFYPVVGLATFSTVLALPFFLLALSPGMLSRMPKSGDWMNAVKVVGGLIEIGAALKFLNTAELSYVTPENAWIDAQFILTAWVVLAAVCGFYLLGFFRTDHDHEEIKIGPGRMVIGTGFLGLALFVAPALFGRPPQSLIWDRLIIGLLPPDVSELASSAGQAGGTAAIAAREVHATDTDPAKAERQEKRFHGVWWGFSYDEALEKASAENKPILIDFTGVNCANCRLMEQHVLPKSEVVELLNHFVTIQQYTLPSVPIASIDSDQRTALAEKNSVRLLDLANEKTNPFYVVISPDQTVIGTKGGYVEPPNFVTFLNQSLAKFKGERKVAQAGSTGGGL
jgi:thiol:disulfide interchange protein DsbD